MIYQYECQCSHAWDVIKSVREIDNPELCGSCGQEGRRIISKSGHFYGAADWNNQRWSPALGRVVNSSLEERKEAKRLGLIEMGNECPNKTVERGERMIAERNEARYDKVCDTSLGEVR